MAQGYPNSVTQISLSPLTGAVTSLPDPMLIPYQFPLNSKIFFLKKFFAFLFSQAFRFLFYFLPGRPGIPVMNTQQHKAKKITKALKSVVKNFICSFKVVDK